MPIQTMTPSPFHTLVLAVTLAAVLTGCSPTLATRGNFLEGERLQSVQQGVSTKDEVAKKLGTPTTVDPFDENTWFYIGEKTSTTAFFHPEVQARKVMIMRFNDQGILQSAEEVDEKSGKTIDVVKKTTPTPGKDVNVFQQFLGNLGRFNSGGPAQGQSPGR